jgi:hypothetical protein
VEAWCLGIKEYSKSGLSPLTRLSHLQGPGLSQQRLLPKESKTLLATHCQSNTPTSITNRKTKSVNVAMSAKEKKLTLTNGKVNQPMFPTTISLRIVISSKSPRKKLLKRIRASWKYPTFSLPSPSLRVRVRTISQPRTRNGRSVNARIRLKKLATI